MHDARLHKLRQSMNSRGLDALLVTYMPNVFYLTGFTGSTAAVLVDSAYAHILVDFRYSVQARAECLNSGVQDYSGKPLIVALAELANELNPKSAGYESEHLTVHEHRTLRKHLHSSIRLRSTSGVVERLRSVKDDAEVELIWSAAGIADAAVATALGEIRRGMTEREIALLIDSRLRMLGAEREAFNTIAAFGPNSACPHASPTDRAIEPGGFLKMDFGALYRGYRSDITRTVSVGNPSTKQRQIYEIVLEAQQRAIDAIRPGVPGREIDSVARNFIRERGYGDNFGHGLGHALGIEAHDGPGFSQLSEVVLEPGMVMTVEPGVYIEGWGGVRIEDDVLVTDSGCELLTAAPKELISI